MNRISFKGGALTAPIPAAIVTVGDMEKYGMLTVAWTGILATQPPKTYVSVRPSRYSYPILKEGGEFVINLPSADMARVVDYIGIYTGKKVDKFEKCSLTKVKSERVSPPTVAECPIALECVVSEVIPMGSHDVFVADIVSVSAREELVDKDGKIRFDRANLLAYAHGEYYSLGEVVGRFGFSTDKLKRTVRDGEKSTEKSPKCDTRADLDEKSRKESSQNGKIRVNSDTSSSQKAKKGRQNAEQGVVGVRAEAERISVSSTAAKAKKTDGDKKPFYIGVTRSRTASKKKKDTDKDKGRPHGKRTKG